MRCQKYSLSSVFLFSSLLFMSNLAHADVSATPSSQGIKLVWSHATESELFRAVSDSSHVPVVFEASFVDTMGPDGKIDKGDPVTILKYMLTHTNFSVTGDEQHPVIHIMSVQDWPMGAAATQSQASNETEDTAPTVEYSPALPPAMNQTPQYGIQPATSTGAKLQQVQNQRGTQYNYVLYSLACKCNP